MFPRFPLIQPAVLLLLLAGCTNVTGKPMNDIQQTVNQEKFQVKKTPNPKEAYEFTVTLNGTPDNLEAVSASAHYFISDCRYDTNKLMGARSSFQAGIPVSFKKINSHTYKGTVYFDAMLDEDYLNQGKPCHWEWGVLDVNFEPKPNISNVIYKASVTDRDRVSDGLYRKDGYITLWKYNQTRERANPVKKLTLFAKADKEKFGEQQKKHLATIRVELRKK